MKSIKSLFSRRASNTVSLVLLGIVSGSLCHLAIASEPHHSDHHGHTMPTVDQQATNHQKHMHGDEHAMHKKMMNKTSGYSRSTVNYDIPNITLVNMHGEAVSLKDELTPDSPILVNFIFTTCTTICPIMSGTFSQVQNLLGDEADKVRMLSITIDPEQDTPEKLRAYAQKFSAGKSWHFLTGQLNDILTALKALDAYRGNKMNHQPSTLLRATANGDWIRIDGLTSAQDLVKEYRQSLAKL